MSDRNTSQCADLSRCDWCGWTLAETVEGGCIAENCSMRPMPELSERGQLRQEIRRLRAALRRNGGCSAVAMDGLHCELRYGHDLSHQTHQGALISWPDAERDPKRSMDREAQIVASLMKGYGWIPHQEGGFYED